MKHATQANPQHLARVVVRFLRLNGLGRRHPLRLSTQLAGAALDVMRAPQTSAPVLALDRPGVGEAVRGSERSVRILGKTVVRTLGDAAQDPAALVRFAADLLDASNGELPPSRHLKFRAPPAAHA
jgi:hypothetical protein